MLTTCFFMSVDKFLVQLRRAKPSINSVNPWRGRSAAVRLRQANLAYYLGVMGDMHPSVLLVGEAPGYRGCGQTGIPFTSERILTQGAAGLFGSNSSCQITGDRAKPVSEASATIVWDVLQRYPQKLPLIWNAYPFHPHRPGEPNSNRPPTIAELEIGAAFLQNLLNLFPSVRQVVAVGNRADESLKRQGIDHSKVRHPSHGGKKEFIAGLEEIFK